ncbi:MAG: flippase-like domain-containing protein [Coriobacteriia bacterium]|nr:flippase-like domain-containing protein [Coriobacteriia bacterium]
MTDGASATAAEVRSAAGAATAAEPRRFAAGTVLRALLSAALLAFVLSHVELTAVSGALRSLDTPWLLASAAAVYAAVALSAFKWGVLLRARGRPLRLLRLTRHYLVGLFFNNFLPTSVGGDVVRAWDAGRDLDDAAEAAASVVAERLIASVALALTAAIGLPFVEERAGAAAAVAVVGVAGVGLSALFLAPGLSERMVSSAMRGRFETIAGWVDRTSRAVGETLRRPGTVLGVLALSVGFQGLVALVNWCLFRALGSPIGFGECVVYTSIVSAATMVPVSVSGHGVREAGYAYFFALAGVGPAAAVTASLLFFSVVAACTLPGAVLFATGRGRRR